MKPTNLILIALVLFVWGYWFFVLKDVPPPVRVRAVKNRPQAKVLPPEPIEEKSEPVAPPAVATLKPLPPSEPSANPDEHAAPPKNAVPFELLNGWVIAYGDVLLGKPSTPEFPNRGFIQTPKLKLWESGVIPFSIHASLPNPERVLRTIAYFHEHTPLRFVAYQGQPDSIIFLPGEELCLSYLGKVQGTQPIYLDARCGEGEIAHEIMHALGFIHEQSRPDRDRYVRINWRNIELDKQGQFEIVPGSLVEHYKGRPFDFKSAMIYSPHAFALDRSQPTFEALGQEEIAPIQNGLSEEDIARLVLAYGSH